MVSMTLYSMLSVLKAHVSLQVEVLCATGAMVEAEYLKWCISQKLLGIVIGTNRLLNPRHGVDS